MVAQTQAPEQAFESEISSITQAISLSEFIQQYVRKYFNTCRLYCHVTGNSLRHIALSIFDSEFTYHKLCHVWPMHPIEFSDYDDDSDNGLTIRVYEDGTYQIE